MACYVFFTDDFGLRSVLSHSENKIDKKKVYLYCSMRRRQNSSCLADSSMMSAFFFLSGEVRALFDAHSAHGRGGECCPVPLHRRQRKFPDPIAAFAAAAMKIHGGATILFAHWWVACVKSAVENCKSLSSNAAIDRAATHRNRGFNPISTH